MKVELFLGLLVLQAYSYCCEYAFYCKEGYNKKDCMIKFKNKINEYKLDDIQITPSRIDENCLIVYRAYLNKSKVKDDIIFTEEQMCLTPIKEFKN